MKIKAVSYARVSSSEQRETGYSLPAQNKLFNDYAESKGLTIVKSFEVSESAKKAGRKTFQEMLSFVKKNKIEVILFEKVDRMTRNFYDLIQIYDLIEKRGIEIHLIKNALILNQESRSQEKLQLDLNVVLARNYVNNLSEEVKKGMQQKLAAGGWNGLAPFGYLNIRKDGRASVIPDPETWPIVKHAFEMSVSGESVLKIAKYMALASNRKVQPSKAHQILTNKFYIGQLETKSGFFIGEHQTFIDPVLFYSSQEALKKRVRTRKDVKRTFLFSGLIKCDCGSKLNGEIKKGQYITYGCTSRKFGTKKCEFYPKYISEKNIFMELDRVLEQVSLTHESYQFIQGIIKEMFGMIDKEADNQIDSVNRAIKAKKSKINRLLDHYDEGLITKEEYFERKEGEHIELIKLQSQHEALANTTIGCRTRFSELFLTLINVREYIQLIDNPNQVQEVIKLIFTNLIFKEGKLNFELTKLGKILISKNNIQNGRSGWITGRSNSETILMFKEFYLEYQQMAA